MFVGFTNASKRVHFKLIKITGGDAESQAQRRTVLCSLSEKKIEMPFCAAYIPRGRRPTPRALLTVRCCIHRRSSLRCRSWTNCRPTSSRFILPRFMPIQLRGTFLPQPQHGLSSGLHNRFRLYPLLRSPTSFSALLLHLIIRRLKISRIARGHGMNTTVPTISLHNTALMSTLVIGKIKTVGSPLDLTMTQQYVPYRLHIFYV